MSKSLYLILLITGLLASCQSAQKQVENVGDQIESVGNKIESVGDKIGHVEDLVKQKLGYFNVDNLNHSVTIISLNSKDVVASDNAPFIELNFEEKKFSGSTGCNRMMGSIVMNAENGSFLQFENIATTKMACPDAQTQFEQELVSAMYSVRFVNPSGEGNYQFQDANGITLFVAKMTE
ncbi:MAG: META domain-containing protein [Bacteroidales bacterium]